jgi:hypothetical protein
VFLLAPMTAGCCRGWVGEKGFPDDYQDSIIGFRHTVTWANFRFPSHGDLENFRFPENFRFEHFGGNSLKVCCRCSCSRQWLLGACRGWVGEKGFQRTSGEIISLVIEGAITECSGVQSQKAPQSTVKRLTLNYPRGIEGEGGRGGGASS